MCFGLSRRDFLFSTGSLLAAGGCRSAPVTGRRQLVLVPESQEIALAQESFAQLIAAEQPSGNARWQQLVNRVGTRIALASGKTDYQWDFRLFASAEQNAFALPGGKVGIYEGILPVCENEAGLAVVMSHEVSHVLARHGSERMSHQAAVQSVGSVIQYGLQKNSPTGATAIMNAYGAAAKYGVILPYSRAHELEADRIGIDLMSAAGYDPAEAPRFWQRFAGGNNGTPIWASTHPSDGQRAAQLSVYLPAATDIYNAAPTRVGLGERL